MTTYASADIFNFVANIDESQEVPPTGSSGTGFGFVTFDDDTNLLAWDINWSGLTGPAIGMHFHNAPAGDNGPIVVDIGTISGLTSPSIGSTVIGDSLANELFDGNLYINIHSQAFPGGEIRGQVIPEPSGLLVLVLGSVIALTAMRRR